MKRWLIMGGIGLAVAVVVVLAAGAIFDEDNNENFPEGTEWLCTNDACKAEFVMTMEQLGEHHQKHYGQPIPCPKCGQTKTVRATRCPTCGKFYEQARGGSACPYCNPDAAKKKTTKSGTPAAGR